MKVTKTVQCGKTIIEFAPDNETEDQLKFTYFKRGIKNAVYFSDFLLKIITTTVPNKLLPEILKTEHVVDICLYEIEYQMIIPLDENVSDAKISWSSKAGDSNSVTIANLVLESFTPLNGEEPEYKNSELDASLVFMCKSLSTKGTEAEDLNIDICPQEEIRGETVKFIAIDDCGFYSCSQVSSVSFQFSGVGYNWKENKDQ